MRFKVPKTPDLGGVINDIKKEISESLGGGQKQSADKSPVTRKIPKLTAAMVRRNIEKGGFLPLQDSTVAIRKWRGNSGRKPLIETGNLLNSVRDEGGKVVFADYGKHHLKAHTVGESTFSKKWGTTGKYVPARNFLLPTKQRASGGKAVQKAGLPQDMDAIIKKELDKVIQRMLKKMKF